MINKKHLVLLASAGAISLAGIATAQANTLEDTRARGAVQCGVSDGLPGFSAPDDSGNWQGLDVDVCRALLQRYWATRMPSTTLPECC